MRIIYTLLLSLIVYSLQATPNWGKTGHRTVGAIATKYLRKSTRKRVDKLLDGLSLAMASTYSDEIKSDKKYREFSPWHYVNYSKSEGYRKEKAAAHGDLIQGIRTCVLKLRDDHSSKSEKAFYLKLLIHLVGDLHQPLHVGNSKDKGGNTILVQWFGTSSNLHRVWDSDMIDTYKMSYSELSNNTSKLSKEEVKSISQGSLLDWVNETKSLANNVYSSAVPLQKLSYSYMYYNFPLVQSQLQKGGLRLAQLLNEVFKRKSTWLTNFLDC